MVITFGEEVRKRREILGLQVKELAEKIGVDPTYITCIERHGKFPSPDVFKKLSNTLNSKYKLKVLYRLGKDVLPIPCKTDEDLFYAAIIDALLHKKDSITDKVIEDILKDFCLSDLGSDKHFKEYLSDLEKIKDEAKKLSSQSNHLRLKIINSIKPQK